MKSHFLIGAVSSGSGKTTLTLGLLRALKNRGFSMQPFKCGPDYIDTKFHELAAGSKAVNLDLFLSSEKHVKDIYVKYALPADVSITEGVMGLFDGYDKAKGSSSEVAEKLNIPVILVLNAKSMAYSAAPLLYGFRNFQRNIRIVGVIFNRVASESHYKFLCDACEEVGLEALGYLPQNEKLEIPSRHLGLNIDSSFLFDAFAEEASQFIEQQIDINRLLALTQQDLQAPPPPSKANDQPSFRSAIAKDAAFNFFYQENIEYLKSRGEVSFFSPLHDTEVPAADFVYLPGGYPELYLKELSANQKMLDSIRQYAERGGKIWAECGGMMYLSASIRDKEGTDYPMASLFPQHASMENMKLKLGYRRFVYKNQEVKGHEFHYSHIENAPESMVQQYNAKGATVDTKLLRYKNVLAGYTHIYWAEMENLLDLFK